MAKNVLSHYFKVEIAENGLVAFQMVKKRQRHYYSAIILDINMPIMDGLEAYDKINLYL